MKTLREIAKENASKLISENIDRYNELAHLSHNHIWLEAHPNGDVTEAEEADRNTKHWIDYPYYGYFDDEIHTISDVELTKHGYHHDCLTYVADGKNCQVDGEFHIDKDGFLHHTHIFDDGVEKEIVVKY